MPVGFHPLAIGPLVFKSVREQLRRRAVCYCAPKKVEWPSLFGLPRSTLIATETLPDVLHWIKFAVLKECAGRDLPLDQFAGRSLCQS